MYGMLLHLKIFGRWNKYEGREERRVEKKIV